MSPRAVAWAAGAVAGLIAAILRGWWEVPHEVALSVGVIVGAALAAGVCLAAALIAVKD